MLLGVQKWGSPGVHLKVAGSFTGQLIAARALVGRTVAQTPWF